MTGGSLATLNTSVGSADSNADLVHKVRVTNVISNAERQMDALDAITQQLQSMSIKMSGLEHDHQYIWVVKRYKDLGEVAATNLKEAGKLKQEAVALGLMPEFTKLDNAIHKAMISRTA